MAILFTFTYTFFYIFAPKKASQCGDGNGENGNCENDLCENGGTCTTVDDGSEVTINCTCTEEYAGDTCQVSDNGGLVVKELLSTHLNI